MSNTNSARLAVAGLGAMGARIAEVLQRRHGEIVVWNRDPAKCDPLVSAGARAVGSFAEAIAESDVSVLTFSTYDVVTTLLGSLPDGSLQGHTVVNLVTGTATEARAARDLVERLGGSYLDGGNMCYPRSIAASDGTILYSGDADAWRRVEPMLEVIAPAARFVDTDPGRANSSYLVAWNVYFAAVGAFHETRPLALAEGLDDAAYGAAVGAVFARLNDFLGDAVDRLTRADFADDQATIATHVAGSRKRATMFAERGLPAGYADLFVSMLDAAVARGASELDINALSAPPTTHNPVPGAIPAHR